MQHLAFGNVEPCQGSAQHQTVSRPILVVDSSQEWAELLCESFRVLGYIAEPHVLLATALDRIELTAPAMICTEARLVDGAWQELQQSIQHRRLDCKLVLVSNCMTPVLAFEALLLGSHLVLAKPAFAQDVLSGLGTQFPGGQLPLGAAKRVYLSQTVTECHSLAEAARQLSVERRSLRRMLAKSPEKASPRPARGRRGLGVGTG